jgi:hypothetical protein
MLDPLKPLRWETLGLAPPFFPLGAGVVLVENSLL